MNRSLQRHLSLMLGAAILASGLVAAVASFMLAYGEARELQDDMLRQIALLVARGAAAPDGAGKADAGVSDPESRVLVIRLPGSPRPEWLPAGLSTGFHTVAGKDRQLRVFVQGGRGQDETIVAQPTDARDEIAIDSALRTLVPLLLLLPLLLWMLVRIVRREFRPIAALSRDLDEQPADRPMPLAEDGVPGEVTPFIRAINRLLDRVHVLLGEQRRFIADAAHELRSPLTALSVQAQNVRQANSLEAARERVAPLLAGIERARLLTEQLLGLARAQAGAGPAAVVDVPALARELIADHMPAARAKGIDLGLDEQARPSLQGAAESLRLVIGNALDNAVKCTPPGGEVTLRLSTEGGMACIEVIDSGPGIPPAERERVFDAFYRAEGATGPGSGLGLAIAREAAARLGGELALDGKRAGPGLVFRYRQRLP